MYHHGRRRLAGLKLVTAGLSLPILNRGLCWPDRATVDNLKVETGIAQRSPLTQGKAFDLTGRVAIFQKEAKLSFSNVLDSMWRMTCSIRFTGNYAHDAMGEAKMLSIVGWRDVPPLRPALEAGLFLCASVTAPTPHASHRTSVGCPMKGLS